MRSRWVAPLIGAVILALLAVLGLTFFSESLIPIETQDRAVEPDAAVAESVAVPNEQRIAPDPPLAVAVQPPTSDESGVPQAPQQDAGVAASAEQLREEDAGLATDGEPTVCSMKTKLPATVEFINDCAESVDVSWIDFDCRERIYRTLDAGSRHSQSTYVTHTWRVRASVTQRLLQQHSVMSATPLLVHACSDRTVRERPVADAGQPVQSCAPREVKPREPPQCSVRHKTADVKLSFENNCLGTTVALYWVDYDCKERPYGLLNPGAKKTQATFVTHTWRFRDATTGALHGEFVPRAPVRQTVATCDCGER